jgi:hypothetical protein
MDIFTQFFQSSPFALPLFIFTARVMDVSLGTLRIISLSRGRKYLAPILGFFEVFIWVVAISQLPTSADTWPTQRASRSETTSACGWRKSWRWAC